MENSSEREVSSAEEALQNSLILQRVLYFLQNLGTFSDWQNIRLVCRFWYSESLSIWRRKAVLSFIRDASAFERPNSTQISVAEFLNQLNNPNSSCQLLEKPYQNYKFENMNFDLPHCCSHSAAVSFWRLVGPNITHLVLKNVQITTATKSSSELLRFLITKTPNLKNLTMVSVTVDGNLYDRLESGSALQHRGAVVSLHCSDFYYFRLSNFPNLQKVTLMEDFTSMKLLSIIAPAGRLPYNRELTSLTNTSVKHLDLMNASISYCQHLHQHLPQINFAVLDHLSINLDVTQDILHPVEAIEILPVFLENHQKTLKIVEVFWCITSVPPENCPINTKLILLTELHLWGNIVNNLSFLQFTPNLKLLHIDPNGFDKLTEMRSKIGSSCTVFPLWHDMVEATVNSRCLVGLVLHDLKCLQIGYKFPAKSITTLVEWMPNLKSFSSILTRITLPVVCEMWPKLEQLHCLDGLCSSNISDENVTGKSTSGEEQSLKALVDLKYLRSFHFSAECGKSILSDHCLEHGFLKMLELTDLQICVSSAFTEVSEKLLKERVHNVKVHRNYPENNEHIAWKCCRNKEYRQFLFNDYDSD